MQNIKHSLSSLLPRRLTLLIKYIYQQFNRVVHKRRLVETNYTIEIRHEKKMHTFFGYYDISPFNSNSNEIVYLKLPNDLKKIKIILSSLDSKIENVLASSYAWNWQQGCRLRWMPNNSREIVFNDYADGRYVSRIINVDTQEERRIDAALYDISPNGTLGLSINFERLQDKRPGYGYQCGQYKEDIGVLKDEGIDLVDIEKNTKTRIVSYANITKLEGCESDDFSKNYINHISFSPSGNKFLFFWLTIEHGVHLANLVVYDMVSNNFIVLETQKRVSHYVWEDEDHIICTAYNNDQSCFYYRYTVSNRSRVQLTEILNEDGHPSLLYNMILTDTYPNLLGYQKIFVVDADKGEKKTLLSIYSDCRVEGERRTDLHPRISPDKKCISFDSNSQGYRSFNIQYINDGK